MPKNIKDVWLAPKDSRGGTNANDPYLLENDDRWDTGTVTPASLVVAGTFDATAPQGEVNTAVATTVLAVSGTLDGIQGHASVQLVTLFGQALGFDAVAFTPDGSREPAALAVTSTFDAVATANNVNADPSATTLVVSSTFPVAVPAESFTSFPPVIAVTATFPTSKADANNSVIARARIMMQAKSYTGGNWIDSTANGYVGVGNGALWKDHPLSPGSAGNYTYFPGTAGDNVEVTLATSTTYDYTIIYEVGEPADGTVSSDGGGVLTLGDTQTDFDKREVKTIAIYPDGGGATLAFYDTSIAIEPFDTIVDTLSNTWTLNRSETEGLRGLIVITEKVWLYTAEDYHDINIGTDLGWARAGGGTIMIRVRTAWNQFDAVPLNYDQDSGDAHWFEVVLRDQTDRDALIGYEYDDSVDLYKRVPDKTQNEEEWVIQDRTTYIMTWVFDGVTDTVTPYIDGGVYSDHKGDPSPLTQLGDAFVASTATLEIGRSHGFNFDNGWEGEIFAVGIWEEALSPADIALVKEEMSSKASSALATFAVDGSLPDTLAQGSSVNATALVVGATFPLAQHTPDKIAAATALRVTNGFGVSSVSGSKENYIIFQPADNEFLEIEYDSSFDPTGDYYEIIMRTGQLDWTPNSTAGSIYLLTNIGAVSLKIEDLSGTTGTLILSWYDGATQTATSTAVISTTTYSARMWGWVKASIQITGGGTDADIKFYMGGTQLAEPGSWTQLGTTVTHGSSTSLTANGTTNGAVNAQVGGNKDSSVEVAWYQFIRVTNDVTVVLDIDLTDLSQTELAAQSFLCNEGRTVNIHDIGSNASWAYCQVLSDGELSTAIFAFMAADGNDQGADWHNYLGTRTRDFGISFQTQGDPTWNGGSYTLNGTSQYFRITSGSDRFHMDVYQSTIITAIIVVDIDDATPSTTNVLWGVKDSIDDDQVGWAMYINSSGDLVGEFDAVNPVPDPPGTDGFLPPSTSHHETADYAAIAETGVHSYAVIRDWYGAGNDDIEVFFDNVAGGPTDEALNWHMNETSAGHYIGAVGTTGSRHEYFAGKVIGWAFWRGNSTRDLSLSRMSDAIDELQRIEIANKAATALAATTTFPSVSVFNDNGPTIGYHLVHTTFPSVTVPQDATPQLTALAITATYPQVTASDGSSFSAFAVVFTVTSTFPTAVPTDEGSPKFAPLTVLTVTGTFDAVVSTGGTDGSSTLTAVAVTSVFDVVALQVTQLLSGSGNVSSVGTADLTRIFPIRSSIPLDQTVDVTTDVDEGVKITPLSSKEARKRTLPTARLVKR